MVATLGQTGCDGPGTSTPNTTAPVWHTTGMVTVTEDGLQGQGEAGTLAHPAGSAPGRNQTMQTGSCAKSTQSNPTGQMKLPWLATDDESDIEKEDLYSQGDRPDRKDGWE